MDSGLAPSVRPRNDGVPLPPPVLSIGPATCDILVADITTLAVGRHRQRGEPPLLGGGGRRRRDPSRGRTGPVRECRTLGGCDTGSAKSQVATAAREARHPRGRPGLARREPRMRTRCSRPAMRHLSVSRRKHGLTSIAFRRSRPASTRSRDRASAHRGANCRIIEFALDRACRCSAVFPSSRPSSMWQPLENSGLRSRRSSSRPSAARAGTHGSRRALAMLAWPG